MIQVGLPPLPLPNFHQQISYERRDTIGAEMVEFPPPDAGAVFANKVIRSGTLFLFLRP